MTKKKKDLSSIGKILESKPHNTGKKPASLSDFLSSEETSSANLSVSPKSGSLTEEVTPVIASKKEKVKECISLYREDIDLIDNLILMSSMAGQKSTKADIYRASLKHFSKLTPEAVANKVKEIRKTKKTHN